MKKIKEKYRKTISFVCSFVLSCGLCFVFAFSSAQTTIETSSISSQNFTLYCISTAKSQLESEAVALSHDAMKTGNGGYVWQCGNYYYVISSAYENKNDATLVSTALSNSNTANEIIEIKFKEINSSPLDISNNDEKNTFNSSIKTFKTCYNELFDISVCIDTNIYDEKKALMEINNIQSKASEITKNFSLLFGKKETAFYQSLNSALIEANQTLENLSQNKKIFEKQTFLSLIRYTYTKICAIYYNFLKNID